MDVMQYKGFCVILDNIGEKNMNIQAEYIIKSFIGTVEVTFVNHFDLILLISVRYNVPHRGHPVKPEH